MTDQKMPLTAHLEELRKRLISSFIALAVGFGICYGFKEKLFLFLSRPLQEHLPEGSTLQYIGIPEAFLTYLKLSLFGGLVLAMPVIFYQLWRFVAPGLYRSEKNAFLPFLIASPVMFLIGASFAYYVVLPLAFDFFLGFQQFGPEGAELGEVGAGSDLNVQFLGTINEYLGLTMKFVIAFGLCFQLPVLLTLMGKAGLVSATGLADMRKYAVVGILVLAAIVTPPDVVTQVILFVVVYGLYEVSIWLVRWVEKRREADLKAQGLWDEEIHGVPSKDET